MGLYLHSVDYSPEDIGYIAAIMLATRIVAPNIWGWLSDKTGRRLQIIRYGSFLACVCFILPIFNHDFWVMAVSIACFSFFWNAVLAQFEVLTLNYLGDDVFYYSRIRMWGSVGFIVVVVGLGALLDGLTLSIFPLVCVAFLLLIWLSSLTITEHTSTKIEHPHTDFWRIVVQRPVLSFLLGSFFLQLSHGSYYTFYSVMLETLEYSRSAIGSLWALGVVAEVYVFWVMHRLLHRFSLRGILLFSLALTVIRWVIIGVFPQSLLLLIFAQCLHAFSFGCAHAVAIEFIRSHFTGRTQGQGQALYSAVSFGAGGAIGALVSGFTWSLGAQVSFLVSALAALIAFVITYWGWRHFSSPKK